MLSLSSFRRVSGAGESRTLDRPGKSRLLYLLSYDPVMTEPAGLVFMTLRGPFSSRNGKAARFPWAA